MRSIISSLDLSSTFMPFTSINLSPGKRPVSLLFCTMAPGSAKVTGRICVTPFAPRSTITARRSEKPKSLRGGGCRWIVNSRGSGRTKGTISGNASSAPWSSNEAEDRHREKPWDSPTGDRLKGGVAKLELVVSVRESAEGLALVTTWNEQRIKKKKHYKLDRRGDSFKIQALRWGDVPSEQPWVRKRLIDWLIDSLPEKMYSMKFHLNLSAFWPRLRSNGGWGFKFWTVKF